MPFQPIIVQIGPFALRWYAVMIMLGVVAATLIALREARRRRPEPRPHLGPVPLGAGARHHRRAARLGASEPTDHRGAGLAARALHLGRRPRASRARSSAASSAGSSMRAATTSSSSAGPTSSCPAWRSRRPSVAGQLLQSGAFRRAVRPALVYPDQRRRAEPRPAVHGLCGPEPALRAHFRL